MIITSSEQMRELTASYYANSDFTKIQGLAATVEQELLRTIGLQSFDNVSEQALLAARQAVAYMAAMRYYRLNDLSHETNGRKAKIDRENEARPFEWQLARDERAHLEEYYRALDRLIDALSDDAGFQQTGLYLRSQALIVKDADMLAFLTGLDPSPWLYQRLIPFLWNSQLYVKRAYGDGWDTLEEQGDDLQHAAQMAVALGGVALMGRRTAVQALPYGMMKAIESDGGGNQRQQPGTDELDRYLKRLSKEQHYWLNEMRTLRDQAAGQEYQHLQMPENQPGQKYMRL